MKVLGTGAISAPCVSLLSRPMTLSGLRSLCQRSMLYAGNLAREMPAKDIAV